MADFMTPKQRSQAMSKVRNANTKPEKLIRSRLHRLGFRFRNNVATLPDKPDIVFPKYTLVVFVNGCFWHQHAGCKRANIPKSNQEYWITHIQVEKPFLNFQQTPIAQSKYFERTGNGPEKQKRFSDNL